MIPNPPLSNADLQMTTYRDLWTKALARAFGLAPGRSTPDHDLARAEIAADWAHRLWATERRHDMSTNDEYRGPYWREALEDEDQCPPLKDEGQ